MMNRISRYPFRMNGLSRLSKKRTHPYSYRSIPKQKDRDAFYDTHAADIIKHEAAKRHFDGMGFSKSNPLPKMDALKQEWAALAAEKKSIRAGVDFKKRREEMVSLLTAKENATRVLFGTAGLPRKSYERGAR